MKARKQKYDNVKAKIMEVTPKLAARWLKT